MGAHFSPVDPHQRLYAPFSFPLVGILVALGAAGMTLHSVSAHANTAFYLGKQVTLLLRLDRLISFISRGVLGELQLRRNLITASINRY